jgi:hypothetical protein
MAVTTERGSLLSVAWDETSHRRRFILKAIGRGGQGM